jgi:chorismate dehydratase
VGVVNYLNTKPMMYGLERTPVRDRIELVADYPSNVARRLLGGEIDLGLVPVAAIPLMKEHYFISDYCIGTEGEIATVALFSEVPMNEIETVYLDYQSRTSVALCRYLMRESWGIQPRIIDAAGESFRDEIRGTTAGVVIGDRAFEQRRISTYIYDLGSEWKAITGLPFVFAAWVSNRPLGSDFMDEFNAAVGLGLQHIDQIVAENPFPLFDLEKYYRMHLSYAFDDAKKRGMNLFLKEIGEMKISGVV